MYNRNQLVICSIILALLYMLSFTSVFQKKRSGSSTETVLLNPRYLSEINRIELKNGEYSILLEKKAASWSGLSETAGSTMSVSFPADNEKIQNFLEELTSSIKVSIISDSLSGALALGMSDTDRLSVCTVYADGTACTRLYFKDSSTGALLFRTDTGSRIYETADQKKLRLGADINSCCDPFIIPGYFAGTKSHNTVQRMMLIARNNTAEISRGSFTPLLDLLHAAVLSLAEPAEQVSALRLENDNGKILVITFYQLSSQEKTRRYICSYSDTDGNTFTGYHPVISGWTYDRLISYAEAHSSR